jgi:hypothetical protein
LSTTLVISYGGQSAATQPKGTVSGYREGILSLLLAEEGVMSIMTNNPTGPQGHENTTHQHPQQEGPSGASGASGASGTTSAVPGGKDPKVFYPGDPSPGDGTKVGMGTPGVGYGATGVPTSVNVGSGATGPGRGS